MGIPKPDVRLRGGGALFSSEKLPLREHVCSNLPVGCKVFGVQKDIKRADVLSARRGRSRDLEEGLISDTQKT
jgi:hypothetical protein